MKNRAGFTLIELLAVVGIIAVLIGLSVGGLSSMTKRAERTKAQELVSNVATAMTAYFQKNGSWPRMIADNGKSDGLLDARVALALARSGCMSLSMNGNQTELIGQDKFGIVTPWATDAIKRSGTSASLSTPVAGTKRTIQDHILHYAVDLDGDGIIEGASVGGENIDVRATAIVWCVGKEGGDSNGKPWPYKQGRRRGDVYSWTVGQTQSVK